VAIKESLVFLKKNRSLEDYCSKQKKAKKNLKIIKEDRDYVMDMKRINGSKQQSLRQLKRTQLRQEKQSKTIYQLEVKEARYRD